MTLFAQRISLLILLGTLGLTTSLSADDHNRINIDADALLRSLPVCAKQAALLTNGSRHGKLKNNSSTPVYAGSFSRVPASWAINVFITFIVKGSVNSSFGKSWYLIESLDTSKQVVWVPSKYIELGKKYDPLPSYTTKDFDQYISNLDY